MQGKIIEPRDTFSDVWVFETKEEIAAIRDQLHRILTSPLFRNSKRYPGFLRHVVERTLEGRSDELKERTLGVEVFQRDPNYDTSLDPIVRVTAGEIRKRIAQYYHDPGHEHEVRIDLPSGSYVPEFRMPSNLGIVLEKAASIEKPVLSTEKAPRKYIGKWIALAIAAVCVATVSTVWWFHSKASQSALDKFWQPILESSRSSPVLVCVGEQNKSVPHDVVSDPTVNQYLQSLDHILIPDGVAMSHLVSVLQGKKRSYFIQSASTTTFTNVQQGPVVLIGALNNDWTLHFINPLRYTFSQTGTSSVFSVVDKQDPANRWSVDFAMPLSKVQADYAIVARFRSTETDHMVVVAAGIGAHGTIAAGEFLTAPEYLSSFAQRAPRDWNQKNMEIVLRTEMINGKPGPPRVIATWFW